MLRSLLTSFCLAAFSAASLACTTDLTGVWKIQFKRDSWDYFDSANCTFNQPHHQLTVECGHDMQFVSAWVDGRRVTWQFTSGFNQSTGATFSGDLEDGSKTIKGTWQFVDSSDNSSGGGMFQATRAAQPAQATSTVAGCITDTAGQPVPGVAVDVGRGGSHHLVHSNSAGCYAVTEVPPGSYFVFARLPGFISATRDNLTVEPGGSQTVNFRMRVAPICECLPFPTTLAELWKRADTVVRVRITGHDPNTPDVKHIAAVFKIWKENPARKAAHEIAFLQHPQGNEIEPYAVGQEFIVFLQWSSQEQAFVRLSSGDGIGAAFAIEGGRIHSAPVAGYEGMEDQQLLKQLSSLATR